MPLDIAHPRDLLPWNFVPRHPKLAVVSNIISTGCLFWFIGSVGVRRARFSLFRRYMPPASAGTTVALRASDGLALEGTYWPAARTEAPGLVLVHGIGACRKAVAANAAWFAARGYAALAIDLRGHGGSGAALHSFGWKESLDVHAALHWLKRRQRGRPVAVLGVSMGGAATLVGPLGPVPADALIVQAVFTTLRELLRCRMALVVGRLAASLVEPFLSFQTRLRLGVWPDAIAPLSAMKRVSCPVLIIGGGDDGFVPQRQTRALHAAAAHVSRELWIVEDDADHRSIADTQERCYRERVLEFLDRTVGAATSAP